MIKQRSKPVNYSHSRDPFFYFSNEMNQSKHEFSIEPVRCVWLLHGSLWNGQHRRTVGSLAVRR